MHKVRYILSLIIMTLLLVSCGEFTRVQRSTDLSLKYSYAKKYYNLKEYRQASDLLTEVVPSYDGTVEGGQAIFMLADCYYHLKEGELAADYFKRYYNSYPKGELAQEARYKAALGLYEASPEPRLDQQPTYQAISELQLFLDLYPDSPYASDIKDKLFSLQDKLAYKEYLSAELYYNMGMYMGNNYESCIITANNALKTYPYTKYKEDFYFLILQAAYAEASNSVHEKMQVRFRNVVDQYHNYVAEFPSGKYVKQAASIFEKAKKHIS